MLLSVVQNQAALSFVTLHQARLVPSGFRSLQEAPRHTAARASRLTGGDLTAPHRKMGGTCSHMCVHTSLPPTSIWHPTVQLFLLHQPAKPLCQSVEGHCWYEINQNTPTGLQGAGTEGGGDCRQTYRHSITSSTMAPDNCGLCETFAVWDLFVSDFAIAKLSNIFSVANVLFFFFLLHSWTNKSQPLACTEAMGLWGAGTLVWKRAWRHAWEGRDKEAFRAAAAFLNPSWCVLNQIQSLMFVMFNQHLSGVKSWRFMVSETFWQQLKKKVHSFRCAPTPTGEEKAALFDGYSLTVSLKVYQKHLLKESETRRGEGWGLSAKVPTSEPLFRMTETLVFPQQLWITALQTKHHLGACIHFFFDSFFQSSRIGNRNVQWRH